MTFKQKVRELFKKYPDTKTDVPEFAWKCLEEFYGAKFYATKQQIKLLFKDWGKLERARKDIAREENFIEPTFKEMDIAQEDKKQFNEFLEATK